MNTAACNAKRTVPRWHDTRHNAHLHACVAVLPLLVGPPRPPHDKHAPELLLFCLFRLLQPVHEIVDTKHVERYVLHALLLQRRRGLVCGHQRAVRGQAGQRAIQRAAK